MTATSLSALFRVGGNAVLFHRIFFSITIFRSKKKEEKLDDLSTGCLLLLVYDGAVWSHRQLRQFAAVVSLGTASRIGGRKCGT